MFQDLRYAFRMIRQHPWFSVAIIGTLALGIGVNTTVFTLVNAVLFKPLAFPGGDRIFIVSATLPRQARGDVGVSYPDIRDFRQAASSFERAIAYATSRRTRENGVRLALGAGAGTIVRMVLNRGLIQIGVGMTIGLTAAFFICRLMESLLLKVSPSDPITFGTVGLTLFSAGLAACLIPARRASRLDPLVALRHE